MASVVVTAGDRPFHVLVGWRDPAQAPAALGDHQGAVMGMCDDGAGDVLCYDALADEDLATRTPRRGDQDLLSADASASYSPSSATLRSSTTSASS